MRTTSIHPKDWRGVLPVPPLARKSDAARSLDFDESAKVVRHMVAGGISRFLYGGNAFLYHITLAEYADLLDWMSGLAGDVLAIPSAGPSYGRAMDQSSLLRTYAFPVVMMLPSGDPRDAMGLEEGYRDFADACGKPLIVYLKDETNFGANREAGLDAVARLVDSGICVGVKYAVVRENPAVDAYLAALLDRVDRTLVISGIGERPAVTHMLDWGLTGFTTGSGCLAPDLSNRLFDLCSSGDAAGARDIRSHFLPVEDLRDAWGPARVLHAAAELAGIAATGPIAPYVTPLSRPQREQLGPAACALVAANHRMRTANVLERAVTH